MSRWRSLLPSLGLTPWWQGCGDIDFVRDLTCVGVNGQPVESSPEAACGNVFKPQSSAVLAKQLDLCSDSLLAGPGSAKGSICNSHGTCVRPLGGDSSQAGSSCICSDGWSGPTCAVPPSCQSGVLSNDGACCSSGVISSVGECCSGEPALTDANGRCCPSGSQLDACGRCAPASPASAIARAAPPSSSDATKLSANAISSHFELTAIADITGVCCQAADMSASEFCCLRDKVSPAPGESCHVPLLLPALLATPLLPPASI